MRIVAEIGSNYKTLDDCLNSISLAKNCGADIVKFQMFDYKSLYGMYPDLGDGMQGFWGDAGIDRGLKSLNDPYMSVTWLPQLKAKADAVGIEFMCSAFSVPLLNEVDKYVSTHKVASAELTHIRMLERLREIGKPVILSTGASSMNDISIALKVLGDTPVTLLYCVAAYPANFINFYHMHRLREEFKKPVGFSDHSTDVLCIPGLAGALGAKVIEKHVNLVGVKDTPDAPHSLSLDMFKLMCMSLRGGTITAGGIGERDMYTTHNRRLIATKDIKLGETFIENENFGIFRSLKPDLKALSPWTIDKVNGKQSKIDIKAGDGIPPEAI